MRCATCATENAEGVSACRACGGTLTSATTVIVTLGLHPGDVFHGRYEILAALGQGGMGIVYKARDRSLDEVVAIKVLRPDFARDPLMAERFKSEIRLARRVRHRNVCGIHDFGEADGLLYISMEFIEGVDLKQIVRQQGGLPLDRAYDVTLQVAAGLQAVHETGIIHRDLKTLNIMIEPSGVARLMDFGIAKREGAEGGVTVTGQVVGTPEYMSPEQAQGHKVDARTDIYSLGIVTYEIFTGHVPFRGDTPISTILKHIHDPPPLEGPLAHRLSPALKDVLRTALAKDPAQRFPSVSAFAKAVRNARTPSRRQQPLSTEALEAPTVVAAPVVRRGRRLALYGAALATAVVLAAALWRLMPGPTVVAPSPSPLATAVPGVARPPSPPSGAPPSPAIVPPAPARPPSAVERSSRGVGASPSKPTPVPPLVLRPTPAAPKPTPTPEGVATPAASAETGLLQIGVVPWGEVAIDGTVVGTTPIDKIPLPAGRHLLRVRHPAYQPVEREIVITPGRTERVIFDLTREGVRRQ